MEAALLILKKEKHFPLSFYTGCLKGTVLSSPWFGQARWSRSTCGWARTSAVGGGAFPVNTTTGTAPSRGDWWFSTCGGHSGCSTVLQ